ncbi:Conserved_hypothetical protein [Hexamita inflata]|uniref:Uncharacterized protein n=1 Tax=Hexamita inflata TaxID=28002 RepID=A0AA86QXP7_9EUKA|nr:Conserved hypothetical protein [Hexamita inflata]
MRPLSMKLFQKSRSFASSDNIGNLMTQFQLEVNQQSCVGQIIDTLSLLFQQGLSLSTSLFDVLYQVSKQDNQLLKQYKYYANFDCFKNNAKFLLFLQLPNLQSFLDLIAVQNDFYSAPWDESVIVKLQTQQFKKLDPLLHFEPEFSQTILFKQLLDKTAVKSFAHEHEDLVQHVQNIFSVLKSEQIVNCFEKIVLLLNEQKILKEKEKLNDENEETEEKDEFEDNNQIIEKEIEVLRDIKKLKIGENVMKRIIVCQLLEKPILLQTLFQYFAGQLEPEKPNGYLNLAKQCKDNESPLLNPCFCCQMSQTIVENMLDKEIINSYLTGLRYEYSFHELMVQISETDAAHLLQFGLLENIVQIMEAKVAEKQDIELLQFFFVVVAMEILESANGRFYQWFRKSGISSRDSVLQNIQLGPEETEDEFGMRIVFTLLKEKQMHTLFDGDFKAVWIVQQFEQLSNVPESYSSSQYIQKQKLLYIQVIYTLYNNALQKACTKIRPEQHELFIPSILQQINISELETQLDIQQFKYDDLDENTVSEQLQQHLLYYLYQVKTQSQQFQKLVKQLEEIKDKNYINKSILEQYKQLMLWYLMEGYLGSNYFEDLKIVFEQDIYDDIEYIQLIKLLKQCQSLDQFITQLLVNNKLLYEFISCVDSYNIHFRFLYQFNAEVVNQYYLGMLETLLETWVLQLEEIVIDTDIELIQLEEIIEEEVEEYNETEIKKQRSTLWSQLLVKKQNSTLQSEQMSQLNETDEMFNSEPKKNAFYNPLKKIGFKSIIKQKQQLSAEEIIEQKVLKEEAERKKQETLELNKILEIENKRQQAILDEQKKIKAQIEKETRKQQQLELQEQKRQQSIEKQQKKEQELQIKKETEEYQKILRDEHKSKQADDTEMTYVHVDPLDLTFPVFEGGSFEVDGVNYDLIQLRIIQHILNFTKLNVDQLQQGAEAYITSEQFDICSIQSMVSQFKEFKDVDIVCKCITCQKECGLMLEQTRIATLCLNCAQPHSVSIQQLNQFANRSFIDQNNSKSRFNENIQTALELKRIIQLYQHATHYQKLKDQIQEIADIQVCKLSLLQMAMFYNSDMLQIPEESQPLILAFASKCGQLFEHYNSLQYLPAHYAFRDTYENTPVGQYGFVWFLILAFQDRFSQCQQKSCKQCQIQFGIFKSNNINFEEIESGPRILQRCDQCLLQSHYTCQYSNDKVNFCGQCQRQTHNSK